LIEETATRLGENFTAVPRGFLKGVVDVLDELLQGASSPGVGIFAAGIDADRIEAVEREEAQLLDQR
jgi:hypothetical protein